MSKHFPKNWKQWDAPVVTAQFVITLFEDGHQLCDFPVLRNSCSRPGIQYDYAESAKQFLSSSLNDLRVDAVQARWFAIL